MTLPDKVRVLVTGHTGLYKRGVLDRFCKFLGTELPNRTAAHYCVEDYIDDMGLFMTFSLAAQQEIWRKAVGKALSAWQKANPAPDYTFFSLHLTFHWHSHVFSPMSWRVPKDTGDFDEETCLEDSFMRYIHGVYKPHYCINLIDDIQAVQSRIKHHHFRLRELLSWRDIEVMMTDLAAKLVVPAEYTHGDQPSFQFERSPVIPIRHPPKMLARYLFEPEVPRIYASFPIGSPRRLEDSSERSRAMAEIDDFRNTLHSSYCVFDPLTIDELPLRDLLRRHQQSAAAKVELTESDQWPIPGLQTLCGEDRSKHEMSKDELVEVAGPMSRGAKSELARQVEGRDFRLIDQSDCVVVYRPTYNTKAWGEEPWKWSTGTYHEAMRARETGKQLFVIRDPACDNELTAPNIGIELTPSQVFEGQPNLNDPENRKKVLTQLMEELDRRRETMISRRRSSEC